MRSVFLSYRRDDTQTVTGFLYQELEAPDALGPGSVFMDIDDIPPGVDFRKVIQKAVAKCEFFLAVIGKQWATVCGADGQPRLMNPNDFVRLEIEAALQRDITVIPVLVEGATMPREEQLPPSLHPLVYLNATAIRPGRDFVPDVQRLVDDLPRAAGWDRPPQARRTTSPRRHGSRSRTIPVAFPVAPTPGRVYLFESVFAFIPWLAGLYWLIVGFRTMRARHFITSGVCFLPLVVMAAVSNDGVKSAPDWVLIGVVLFWFGCIVHFFVTLGSVLRQLREADDT